MVLDNEIIVSFDLRAIHCPLGALFLKEQEELAYQFVVSLHRSFPLAGTLSPAEIRTIFTPPLKPRIYSPGDARGARRDCPPGPEAA